LLRAGHDDYVINAEALAYMRERALASHVIGRLIEQPDRCFADQAAWSLIWDFYRDLKAYRCAPTGQAQGCAASALRSHLQGQDRIRHPRPSARTAPCQQG